MVNIPELCKSIEWVEEQAALPWWERVWKQGTWSGDVRHPVALSDDWEKYQDIGNVCGTTYCVAGDLVVRHGWSVLNSYAFKDGDKWYVSEVAAKILDITDAQAYRLFYAFNSAEDVRRIAENIAGEPL